MRLMVADIDAGRPEPAPAEAAAPAGKSKAFLRLFIQNERRL